MRERRHYALVAAIWAAWLVAGLGIVIGGVRSGTIVDNPPKWIHFGGSLWPLFGWDYPWYDGIAKLGYPAEGTTPPAAGFPPQYAFFPLWPLVLRATGSIPDWFAAFALVVLFSGVAFVGVAAAIPSGRAVQAAAAFACWPGSWMLLFAYPDVLALAAAACAAALALRAHPWAAGVVAAVAAVARPTGFLIALPLALATRGSRAGRIFAVAAPLAGAAAVHAFFWARSGEATAFFRAQSLPIWQRNGPARLAKWPGHVIHALGAHALWVVPAAVVGTALVVVVARQLGRAQAAVVAYALVVLALLLGAQSTQTRIQSGFLALAAAALVVLWRRGAAYFPWAVFATVVVAISLFSGSVTSIGRQALFAFPLYWAAVEAPRPLRHPIVVAAAIAVNVAYTLTFAKYPP